MLYLLIITKGFAEMLQRKLRVEQFERVYKLEPVSVDLAADRIVGFLTSLSMIRCYLYGYKGTNKSR